MRVKYDRRVDALYVELSDRAWAYTEDVSRSQDYERGVDYAKDGTPIGVEFLNASRGVDLTDIPRAQDIATELARYNIRVLAPGDRG